MSIENIKDKILIEASEYSKGVLGEAEKSRDIILKEAQDKAKIIEEKAQSKSREEADLVMSRMRSVASLEERKLKLKAMQDQINQSFQLALDKLADMEEGDYLEMLSSAIVEIGGEGGELLLNARDKERLGKKLIERVNHTEKVGTLSLSQDVIQTKGGFILRRGSTEINSTLEIMINGIREATIPQVVEVLYGSQGE